MKKLLTKAGALLKSPPQVDDSGPPKWYVQAFRSKPLMYLVAAVIVVGVIVYLAVKSAKEKLRLDQVDTSKLPGREDVIENITREELDDIVADCRLYFDNISAVPGTIVPKNELMRRLLRLSDYELGLVNNQYNNLYSQSDTNLYHEISDDYWYSYDADLRTKLLSRLKTIGAGKTKH